MLKANLNLRKEWGFESNCMSQYSSFILTEEGGGDMHRFEIRFQAILSTLNATWPYTHLGFSIGNCKRHDTSTIYV